MRRIQHQQSLPSLLAFAIGAAFAVASFGTMALDPSAVQWLLISDRGQAFLGWHMARNAPASLPLGAIPGYVTPGGASLALADACPLFSLLLLPISRFLPPVFQHAGIWLVLSYGLMALFSFRLLARLISDTPASLVAMLLVLVNPVLLFRRFHPSLCAHWMIVAALLIYFAPVRDGRVRERVQATLLLVVAAGTHPYLVVMVLGIVGAAAWARSASWTEVASSWALYVIAASAALSMFGYVGHADLEAAGFGAFSTDLLSLLDPDGWSRIVPDVPSGPGEYEGFAFLGIGVLLVIAADAALRVDARRSERPVTAPRPARTAPLLVIVAAFTVFALSSHVRLGKAEILDLTAPYALLEPLPSMLRASGRFVWPLYYLVVFAALASLRRRTASRSVYLAIVLIALAIQLIDGWPRYATQDVALMALTNQHRPLRAPAWGGVGKDYREIRLIPPAVVDTDCDEGAYPRFYYMPFAFVAGVENVRINSGHLSRYAADVEPRCRAQTAQVLSGSLEPDVVYVLSPSILVASGLDRSASARCGLVDGYHVCVAAGRDTRLARALRADAP